MRTIYPSFFYDFRCKAKDCRHSCCKGWEIEIDAGTYESYMEEPGDFGKRLRSAIGTGEGVHTFLLREDGRCPMLRDDGLCELILRLGEDRLCDVCYLHPRFYQEIGDAELAGLGLSCEAAAEKLVSQGLQFTVEDEDGAMQGTDFSGILALLHIAFPRELLVFRPDLSSEGLEKLKAALYDDDPFDETWNGKVSGLPCPPTGEDRKTPPVYGDVYRYFLFRQLERLYKGEAKPQTAAAYASALTSYVYLRDLQTPDPVRHMTEVSEEVEYSTTQVDRIFKYYESR